MQIKINEPHFGYEFEIPNYYATLEAIGASSTEPEFIFLGVHNQQPRKNISKKRK